MLADYLRTKRQEQNFTVSALARASGLSHSYIRRLENAEIRLPSLRVIQALAQALSVSPEAILQAAGVEHVPSISHGQAEDNRAVGLGTIVLQDPQLNGIVSGWHELRAEDRRMLYRVASELIEMRRHTHKAQAEQT